MKTKQDIRAILNFVIYCSDKRTKRKKVRKKVSKPVRKRMNGVQKRVKSLITIKRLTDIKDVKVFVFNFGT
jgi:hypothetical protein